MAIRTFNSVGGFSVGENPANIILANGDITTTNIVLTGNILAANVLTNNLRYANGVAWDFQETAGNNNEIQFNINDNFSASANFTFDPSSSLLTVIGNAAVTGIKTDNYYYANGNPVDFQQAAGNDYELQYNTSDDFAASANLTFNPSTNILTIVGNVVSTNANLGNVASANYFTGTLTTAAQPNITSVGTLNTLTVSSGTQIAIATSANLNLTAPEINLTGNAHITGAVDTSSTIVATGNITGGNINTAGKVVASTLTSNVSTGTAPLTVTSTTRVANLNVAYANVSDRVNISTQTSGNAYLVFADGLTGNISETANAIFVANTSTGTLYATAFNGNITGNITAPGTNSQVLFNDSGLINADGGMTYNKDTDTLTVAGNVAANNLSATNDLTVGRDATISGNLTVGGNTIYINVTNLSVRDPIIEMGGAANGGNAASYDGKDRGMLMHNYYSNGSGPVNTFFGWKTGNGEYVAAATVTDFTGEVVTIGTLANIRASTFKGNVEGTINTAAQPNITSLGTLTGLTVNGNANVNNLGSSGIVTATGNVIGGNLVTGGVANVTGNVIGGNLTTAGQVVATGNVTGGNINTGGVVAATGNVSGGNITTAGNVVATSNVQANNAVISNNIKIGNTNVNWATLTTTAITANQTIATISTTGIRGVEFLVKGEESAGGKYSIATISAVHNGTDVDYSVYGTVGFGGSTGSLSVNYNSGNIRLAVTPASSNSTVWTTQYRTI
jgi:hypothetical protein